MPINCDIYKLLEKIIRNSFIAIAFITQQIKQDNKNLARRFGDILVEKVNNVFARKLKTIPHKYPAAFAL